MVRKPTRRKVPYSGKGRYGTTTAGRPLPVPARRIGKRTYRFKRDYGCLSKFEANHLKKFEQEKGYSVRLIPTHDGNYWLYRAKARGQ